MVCNNPACQGMEMVASPVPNDTPYVSAPTSPTKWSLNNVCFYSVPTSPTRTPKTHEDENNRFGEFEFETSRYFDLDGLEFEKSQSFEYLLDHDQEQQQQQCGDSQPAMAFADELFCNGLVLPLKLPPRLQDVHVSKGCNLGSIACSPRSPSFVLRLPFSRRTWNDGYDPFTAALENVKAEQKGLASGSHHRRARSLSPLRTITSQRSANLIGLNPQASLPHLGTNAEQLMKQNGSACASWLQNRATGSSKQSTNMPTKNKGVDGARSLETGQVRLDSLLELAGHTQKTGQRDQERQRVKAFPFKSASICGESSKEKPRNRMEALWKPAQNPRGWSYRKSVAAVHGKRRVYQEMKTVIQYRPRLFPCFGFGIRCPRTIT